MRPMRSTLAMQMMRKGLQSRQQANQRRAKVNFQRMYPHVYLLALCLSSATIVLKAAQMA